MGTTLIIDAIYIKLKQAPTITVGPVNNFLQSARSRERELGRKRDRINRKLGNNIMQAYTHVVSEKGENVRRSL